MGSSSLTWAHRHSKLLFGAGNSINIPSLDYKHRNPDVLSHEQILQFDNRIRYLPTARVD